MMIRESLAVNRWGMQDDKRIDGYRVMHYEKNIFSYRLMKEDK